MQQKYLYESEKGKDPQLIQANRLTMGKDAKMVIAGCEDGVVRLFDYNSSKVVKKLQSEASISSVITWDWLIAAGDNKGSLNLWDLRTYRLLDSRQEVHLQKYDTGITGLCRNGSYLFSGGADGVVKVFS